jgi:hypothetical protein
MRGDTAFPGSGQEHTANWTAGYSRGATSITLSSTTGLSIGSLIALDQTDNSNTDTGNVWVCQTQDVCSSEGPSGAGRSGRAQMQWVKVTNIAGSVITITPGLYMPNWASGRSPGAWWVDSVLTGCGVEDMSLNYTSASTNGIVLFNAYGNWVKGVRSISSERAHVWCWTCAANTIRDSYFYQTLNHQSQSYGFESYSGGDNLVENNIFQQIAEPLMINGEASGTVLGYNHVINNYETASADSLYGDIWLHSAGIDNLLIEGHSGQAFFSDAIHGTHHFITLFRSRFLGWESGKTAQTFPMGLRAVSRYESIIGSVLGKTSYHTTYSCDYPPGGCNESVSVFYLGESEGAALDDSLVASTLMRWGNWDDVTNAVRWCGNSSSTGWSTRCSSTSEVPTGLSLYANAVPATETLPASFYYSSQPSWWPPGKVWPPIGPDVTGGNISNTGGHANTIPAQDCYLNVMGGPADGSGSVLAFNAAACYSASASSPTVTTTTASGVTSTAASSGGNVTSDGGDSVTSRGVCYATSSNPTTPCTSDGTGTGTFSSSLTGLSASTTYHYRAFATNSVGTSYGSDLTFTTSAVQGPGGGRATSRVSIGVK